MCPQRNSVRRRGSVPAVVLAALGVLTTPAFAAGPFSALDGAWRGSGSVTMPGGQTEQLTCKAYYNAKNGGADLGIALSCASPSNKIDLRANLAHNGSGVRGSWEERAFNSSGEISGTATAEDIDLAISGTLEAKMKISIGEGAQSVSISTDGTGFQSVKLRLSRL